MGHIAVEILVAVYCVVGIATNVIMLWLIWKKRKAQERETAAFENAVLVLQGMHDHSHAPDRMN